MARWLIVVLTAAVVFTGGELICRGLFEVADSAVPLIVLPLTALAILIVVRATAKPRSRS